MRTHNKQPVTRCASYGVSITVVCKLWDFYSPWLQDNGVSITLGCMLWGLQPSGASHECLILRCKLWGVSTLTEVQAMSV